MEQKLASRALIGFIFGLISLVAWIIPLFGFPVTIVGLVFSSQGLKSESRKGLAIAGLVLSVLFLVATLINSVIGAMMGVGAI